MGDMPQADAPYGFPGYLVTEGGKKLSRNFIHNPASDVLARDECQIARSG